MLYAQLRGRISCVHSMADQDLKEREGRVLSNDIFSLCLGLIDMTQPYGPNGFDPKIKGILGGGGASALIWGCIGSACIYRKQ